MIHGKDVIIKKGSQIIAGATSCEIQEACDVIEITSPSSGQARDYIPGRSSWNASSNHLVVPGYVATAKQMIGQKVTLTMSVGTETLTGNAICTQWQVTGKKGSLAQGAFSFQGCGPLE